MLVVTKEFEALATSLLEFHGYPELPMAIIPHPFNLIPHDEVIAIAEESKRDILTKIAKDVKI